MAKKFMVVLRKLSYFKKLLSEMVKMEDFSYYDLKFLSDLCDNVRS